MYTKFLYWLTLFTLLLAGSAPAQNYYAIQGSPYGGGLAAQNNPASLVNMPYKWDLTLFGVQAKTITNAVTIYDYNYLSSPANSAFYIQDGNYARRLNLNLNVNLLNARIALNQKSGIAFGANLRSYTNLQTSTYNFIDTLHENSDFLALNRDISSMNMHLLSSSWIEAYLSYGRTLHDNEFNRLNAGITIRVSNGISGAYADINKVQLLRTPQPNGSVDNIGTVEGAYGYSANYDHVSGNRNTKTNINNFLAFTDGGASFDAGIEYLIKPQGTTSFYDDVDYYDYDWKIGFSLLDIGGNQYKYGTQSRTVNGIKGIITSNDLNNKFDSSTNTFQKFNDSLATMVNMGGLGGKFIVLNPVRMVLNIDHYFSHNIYLNADLSLNIPLSKLKKRWFQVKETNLLTVTPRWETKRWGVYLPVQISTVGSFWVGAAIKAGPLLLGVHNLRNLFSSTSTQNGGGYIALIFRAAKDPLGNKNNKINCPKAVW